MEKACFPRILEDRGQDPVRFRFGTVGLLITGAKFTVIDIKWKGGVHCFLNPESNVRTPFCRFEIDGLDAKKTKIEVVLAVSQRIPACRVSTHPYTGNESQ